MKTAFNIYVDGKFFEDIWCEPGEEVALAKLSWPQFSDRITAVVLRSQDKNENKRPLSPK